MIEQANAPLASLYEQDETAWLEQTAKLLAERRFAEVDLQNLCEYLADMARRDRREVFSGLRSLLIQLLKWENQQELRSNSWRGAIRTQRRELEQLLESRTLRRHVDDILVEVYRESIEQATVETGLPETVYPAECSMSLEDILTRELGM